MGRLLPAASILTATALTGWGTCSRRTDVRHVHIHQTRPERYISPMHARQLNKACNSSRNHAAKAALDQIKQDVEVHQLNLQGSSTLPTRVPCGAGQHALCRISPTGQSNLQSPSMLPLSLLQSGTGCMPSRRSLLRRHRLCLFCGLDCSLLEVDMRHSRLSGSRQEHSCLGRGWSQHASRPGV